ncbi:hypothetical protein D7Y13_17845 [Corallococcus praedator]|uniref:Lipase n=1 Tax=Corallococcus praedator TaxID=2316724 RepID=A0ABX9QGQ2_9BACT|nr:MULTISPECIES: hypothetical protein [Corallococcus]RKH31717.1 hypothetical protein D7X75_18510 [Corallococcus sp. CA031C]RKI07460.1 hypothetical protein D7Y13_17845 [Corallococcus praedator]
MKKSLFLGAMALGAVACTPEIAQDAPNTNVGLAEFDPTGSPAVVPSPNDLAINRATKLVNAPINPLASAAEQEFTRDYLNSLNGFPTSAIATTKVQDLDPRSMSAQTVIFIDLKAGTPIATKPVTPTIAYNETTDLISLIPPVDQNTGLPAWPKGGRYAVALIGGENGLKTTGGNPIIGSATWAFASSVNPLVTCEDLTAPDCAPATEIIPSTETDPAKRLADQTASAVQLEQLRRGYAPLIEGLVKKGFKREDVVLLWTFTILDQPEATINLAANARLPTIIPFPNDLLRAPATATAPAHLNFPVPAQDGLQKQLFQGLNTLDGFSTTGAIVSENGDAQGVLDGTQFRDASDGPAPKVDPASLAAGVKFLKLSNTTTGTAPDVAVCLVNNTGDCGTSVGAAGVAPVPQQLQIVPKAPLDGATQYGAVLTTDLMDTQGRKVAPATAFALMRLANPVFANGKSQISSVPDSLAQALEPVRAAYKPYFDGLAAAGLPRSKVALGWSFTTQSTTSVLSQLHALPTAVSYPNAPNYLAPITTPIKATMAGRGLATDQIGNIYEVQANTPFLLTGPSGTLNPNPQEVRPTRYPFMLFLPAAAAPASGYPVVVFGHGLKSSRGTVIYLANKLAGAGYAVAAMDTVFHGERSSCVGSAGSFAGSTSDDSACADSTNQRCETDVSKSSYGRCVARTDATRQSCDDASRGTLPADFFCSAVHSQGRCMADNKCEGGSFKLSASTGAPEISGWNMLNPGNLFATRDNFRHSVVDFAQFQRVLSSPELATLLGDSKLDATQVEYVGQSLGGILGTLITSTSPRVNRSVLNAAGGNLTGILLTSPAFAPVKDAFLGQLGTAGIVPGIPAFDTFISLAGTILDPADPRNYAYGLDNTAAAGTDANVHRTLIQSIKDDQVIPNTATAALIASANRAKAPRTVATYMFPASAANHSFLAFDPTAQDQVVSFLQSGTVAAQP